MLQVGRARLNVHHVNAKQDAVQACHVLVICSRCTHVCAQVNAPCPAVRCSSLKALSRRILSLYWEGERVCGKELHGDREGWESGRPKIQQTTKRNARIITLAAIAGCCCNRRQGVDLKLKLIGNSVRIPKRECRQQATGWPEGVHLYFLPCMPRANISVFFLLLLLLGILTLMLNSAPHPSRKSSPVFWKRTLTAFGNKLNYASIGLRDVSHRATSSNAQMCSSCFQFRFSLGCGRVYKFAAVNDLFRGNMLWSLALLLFELQIVCDKWLKKKKIITIFFPSW